MKGRVVLQTYSLTSPVRRACRLSVEEKQLVVLKFGHFGLWRRLGELLLTYRRKLLVAGVFPCIEDSLTDSTKEPSTPSDAFLLVAG